MHHCPSCQGELSEQIRYDIPLKTCTACRGIQVPHNRLIPLLSALGTELFADMAIDQDIEPIPDPGSGLSCPGCQREMNHFGYMGTRLVHLDRCSPCSLLWIQTDALAVMAALSLRTSQRRQHRHDLTDDQMEGMSRRFRSILKSRLIERALF